MNSPSTPDARTSVLFVCLGNICRSPLAEGVFRHLVGQAGLEHRFHIDSAGTGDWHVGQTPDARATMVAATHGVRLESRARQVVREDLHGFDWVIAMDRDNLRALQRLGAASGGTAQIRLLRAFDPGADGDEVPDPYYGGASGFEAVYRMVHQACAELLRELAPRD